MKKLGAHRWSVVAGVLLVAVSVGAAACDSSDNDQARGGRLATAGNSVQANTGAMGPAGNGNMMAQRRQAVKERREARAERHEALLDNLRDKMSAADQALYDQLTASLEQQRTAAQQARQKLADTLKQLRALADKYLDLNGSGTD